MAKNLECATERSLVMIKPGHSDESAIIFQCIDAYLAHCGKRVFTGRVPGVPEEIVRAHYSIHRGKEFYERLVRQVANKVVDVAVYEGKEVISLVRQLVGSTDPSKAGLYTIRFEFANENESSELAKAQNRAVDNVVHASDGKESAEEEIKYWIEQYFHLNPKTFEPLKS